MPAVAAVIDAGLRGRRSAGRLREEVARIRAGSD
jgi:hypothetical protein